MNSVELREIVNCDAVLRPKINVCFCMFHASVSSSLFYTSDMNLVELKESI
jgi:hypothetical protein